MPTKQAASFIERSLADGENRQDFVYMLDTLTTYRSVFHPGKSREQVEEITGLILCLLVTPKPSNYLNAMRTFRRLYRGISESKEKQIQFNNAILPAAFLLSNKEDVIFRPSLYFFPLAVLGFDTSFSMTTRDREIWFRENLPNWF